ncbi:MAG: HAMP domain-containing sensor histidine kinase [Chitinophagaceae bacterium]
MASFSIRSSTIRLGIFISTLIIALILVFQLIWLKRVYHFEQKQFDYNVIKVIRSLYEDIDANAYYSSHLNELVENPEPHLYIANLPLQSNNDSLVDYLLDELENFNVFTNCHVGIYSAKEEKYIYSTLLESAGKKEISNITLPATRRSFDHLTLYFPNRQQYILAQMNFWIISSAVLLVVLLLFSGSLYYFYKQKFLNETQKDFIHNFTHEFKTPVSVISLAADVLKNPAIVDKPEKLATYAGIVEYQSGYLQHQIEKLLKFANAEASHLHLSKEKVNIHALIEEAVANLTPLINQSNTQLTFEFNAKDPFLIADKDYLVIVITNLIDNAIKYSRSPKILIHTGNTANSLFFSIKDNGIGIESKNINKIFKKFFRFHKGDETYPAKGFGIGLSFVKKIVDAHGGKIKVDSSPGTGSEFTIELPT